MPQANNYDRFIKAVISLSFLIMALAIAHYFVVSMPNAQNRQTEPKQKKAQLQQQGAEQVTQAEPRKSLEEIFGYIQPAEEVNNATGLFSLYNEMLPSLPAHDLYCIPSNKSYCTSSGCVGVDASVFVLIGKIADSSLFMARCDRRPCDVYGVELVQSGAFTSFNTKGPHGVLFKTSQLDQSFVEVVTLGTDSFVSNGYCYPK